MDCMIVSDTNNSQLSLPTRCSGQASVSGAIINDELPMEMLVEILEIVVRSVLHSQFRRMQQQQQELGGEEQMEEFEERALEVGKMLEVLNLVCRKWRDAVRGTPAIWTRVDLSFRAFAMQGLERCGDGLPLQISGHIRDSSPVFNPNDPKFCDMFIRCIPRITHFTVGGAGFHLGPFLAVLNNLAEDLPFIRTQVVSWRARNLDLMRLTCAMQFPVLHTLELYNVQVDFQTDLPTVKKAVFHYSDITCGDFVCVLQTLSRMPCLEYLEFYADCYSAHLTDSLLLSGIQCQLPNLLTLNVRLTAEALEILHRVVDMPKVCSGAICMGSLRDHLAFTRSEWVYLENIRSCRCQLTLAFMNSGYETIGMLYKDLPDVVGRDHLHAVTKPPSCRCLNNGFISCIHHALHCEMFLRYLGESVTSRIVNLSITFNTFRLIRSCSSADWAQVFAHLRGIKHLSIDDMDLTDRCSAHVRHICMSLSLCPELKSIYLAFAYNEHISKMAGTELIRVHSLSSLLPFLSHKFIRFVINIPQRSLKRLEKMVVWNNMCTAFKTRALNVSCEVIITCTGR